MTAVNCPECREISALIAQQQRELSDSARVAADAVFPELLLAPENDQRADDYAAGYMAGASALADAVRAAAEQVCPPAVCPAHPGGTLQKCDDCAQARGERWAWLQAHPDMHAQGVRS